MMTCLENRGLEDLGVGLCVILGTGCEGVELRFQLWYLGQILWATGLAGAGLRG